MASVLIRAGEIARKHNDEELDNILVQALMLFSELDAIVYGIELEIEKYTEIERG
jgi:hypothetical protein